MLVPQGLEMNLGLTICTSRDDRDCARDRGHGRVHDRDRARARCRDRDVPRGYDLPDGPVGVLSAIRLRTCGESQGLPEVSRSVQLLAECRAALESLLR